MQKIINQIKESLSTQILIALVLGVIAGLFFGEMATSLNFIGDAFVRLFQMPVIPYQVGSVRRNHKLLVLALPLAQKTSSSCPNWIGESYTFDILTDGIRTTFEMNCVLIVVNSQISL